MWKRIFKVRKKVDKNFDKNCGIIQKNKWYCFFWFCNVEKGRKRSYENCEKLPKILDLRGIIWYFIGIRKKNKKKRRDEDVK